MKLDKLAITWNSYTFENDGIPPESYGGKVVFRDAQGNLTQITLSPSAVDQIMQTVAAEVANNAKRMLAEMTKESVRDSARPKSIAPPAEVEEAEFTEAPKSNDDMVPF
jgi:hypothetical protein